jgi:hypothetical protein
MTEQADGKSKKAGDYHSFLKRQKRRLERRRAKVNPDAPATYRRYKGWET